MELRHLFVTNFLYTTNVVKLRICTEVVVDHTDTTAWYLFINMRLLVLFILLYSSLVHER